MWGEGAGICAQRSLAVSTRMETLLVCTTRNRIWIVQSALGFVEEDKRPHRVSQSSDLHVAMLGTWNVFAAVLDARTGP